MPDAPATVDSRPVGRPTPIHPRLARAEHVSAVTAAQHQGQSQREAIAAVGVPRSTVRHWTRPAAAPAAPAALAAFIETPDGVQWRRTLVMAAHWCIGEVGGAGVRVVCQFLELSGLSAFVGASYGSQQAFQAELEQQIIACAAEQRAALAKDMPHRTLTIAEDETWQDGMRLVALDLSSGFILVEEVAEERSAAAWTRALTRGLDGLNVTVVQGTSDEAKGLLAHVQRDLGAHHSPDLFHLQQAVGQAMTLPLARAVAQAETDEASAKAAWREACAAKEAYARRRHGPGRPPAFAARIEHAFNRYLGASLARERAQSHRDEAKALIGSFSEADHPFDLEHGQMQTPARLAERLGTGFARLETIAAAAAVSARQRAQLAKAKRLIPSLLATLTFFFTMITARVQALNLAPAIEQAMLEDLIPALYLERVAARSTHADTRQQLRAVSAQRLAPLQQPSHPIQSLDAATHRVLEQVAGDGADLFQRSSSAVEGRNGYLSLYQHGHHRLSTRKQAVLTALHNFHLTRPDGTTAAERLFGRPHAPLFEQVVQRMPWPARPAQRRPRPPKPPYLVPVAA